MSIYTPDAVEIHYFDTAPVFEGTEVGDEYDIVIGGVCKKCHVDRVGDGKIVFALNEVDEYDLEPAIIAMREKSGWTEEKALHHQMAENLERESHEMLLNAYLGATEHKNAAECIAIKQYLLDAVLSACRRLFTEPGQAEQVDDTGSARGGAEGDD